MQFIYIMSSRTGSGTVQNLTCYVKNCIYTLCVCANARCMNVSNLRNCTLYVCANARCIYVSNLRIRVEAASAKHSDWHSFHDITREMCTLNSVCVRKRTLHICRDMALHVRLFNCALYQYAHISYLYRICIHRMYTFTGSIWKSPRVLMCKNSREKWRKWISLTGSHCWPSASANHKQTGWGLHQWGWSDDACATQQRRPRHELAWIWTDF